MHYRQALMRSRLHLTGFVTTLCLLLKRWNVQTPPKSIAMITRLILIHGNSSKQADTYSSGCNDVK